MESAPQGGLPHVPRITMRQIVGAVEHATGEVIRGHCNVRAVCFARYIAFYLARRVAHASLQRISDFFGMSKSVIIYGDRKIATQLATDPALAVRIVALTTILTTAAGDIDGQKGKGRDEDASRERRRNAGARA